MRFIPRVFTAEEDRVAVVGRSEGLLNNGTPYIKDGRIVSLREHSDTQHVTQTWGPLLDWHV